MSSRKLPQLTKSLILKKSSVLKKPTYDDAVLESRPIPQLKAGQVLLRIGAVALNHRDVWIRKGSYPHIGYNNTFGADGAGTVIAAADANDPLLNKRVFMTPMRGWKSDPDRPESEFTVIGGVKHPELGTFSEYVVVEREEVLPTPDHLDDIQAAAWPLAGVTAWRATMINARIEAGHNVLITGIGGGVALIALQLCLAKGANVYVTSGSQEKIDKAIALGAKGGANYKDKEWPKQIGSLLAQTGGGSKLLNSVIDSGGGEIIAQSSKILNFGARIVCYGMTASPKITFTMREVVRSQQLIGSEMGSLENLKDASKFLADHKIVPLVSHVFNGLENAEDALDLMKRGDQFGKIVIQISRDEQKNPGVKL